MKLGISYLAAVVTGLLITLSFPTVVEGVQFPNLGFLVWFALIPFIRVIRYATLRQAAALTFVMSFTCNALTSYWIYHAMHTYGELSPVASLAGIASMASILAALHAVFVVAALGLGRMEHVPIDLIFSSLWVLYEWVRTHAPFGGYPWSNLAYSQGNWLELIQVADVFGVYGITFIIVFANCMFVDMLEWFERRRAFPLRQLIIVVLCIGATVAYGAFRLKHITALMQSADVIKVGLVQPDIPQEVKWDPDAASKNLQRLTELTVKGIAEGAELIIWPEASYPDLLPTRLEYMSDMSHYSVPIAMGAVSIERDEQGVRHIYNSALQIDPGGYLTERYHKQHLVPLGEYVPLQDVLWFLETVVPAIGNFSPGRASPLLEAAGHSYGITICYEDLFPNISKGFVSRGARFLVNMTNDAWYKDSSQLDQHMNFSRFRAIENRRAMVRSTNTGRTAALAPTGQVIGVLPKFQPGVLVTDIPLLEEISVYTDYGDLLWFLLLFGMLAISVFIMRMKHLT